MKSFNFNTKIDFLAKAKYVLIAVLVVIVSGLAIMGIFGFNKSEQYKGGYEVKITADEIFGDNAKEMKKISTKAFQDEGLSFLSVKDIDEGRILSYTFEKEVKAETLTALQEKLKTSLTALEIEVVQNKITAYTTNTNAWWALLAAGILAVVAFLYVAIRYRWSAAFTLLCSMIVEVLLLLSLTSLTRIVVTTAYLATVVGSLAILTLFEILFFSAVKEKRRNEVNKDVSDELVINKAMNSIFMTVLVVLGAIALATLMFVILGSSLIKWSAFQILLSGIVSAFTILFISGSFFAFFKSLKKKK